MLYDTLRIRNVELKNRIIAAPVVSNSGDDNGTPTEKSFEIYDGYANSGVGMVVVEQHAVHPWGRNRMNQFRLYDNHSALILQPLTKLFRDKNIPIVAQLNFAGAGASGKTLLEQDDFSLVSPSGLRNPRDLIDSDSHSLDTSEITEIIDSFGYSAKRAVNLAKYSGVQIYACHGYLIGQFLSPITNHREDSYGGDIKSRAKLLFEVVKTVKASIGNHLLSVRLGASDQMPGKEEHGLTLPESVWIAKELANMEVDWISVSGNHCIYGIGEDDNDTAYFSPYSQAIYSAVKNKGVAVDCTGGIRSSKKAEAILSNGVCNLIGIGRPLISNKYFLKTF